MKTTLSVFFALILVAGMSLASAGKQESKRLQTGQGAESMDYRKIPFQTIDGKATDLDAYKGKVILIVNVASKCGFTPQYEGLEKLYNKYKDKGLVILGFPANNFKNQEPGTDQEIQKFCSTTYGVTFPMMSKISVVGADMHPLYQYLVVKSPLPGPITWNFNKFLLDKTGVVKYRYPSDVEPLSPELVGKIEELLK